jgi:tetratricopeptide (TPR) repeat protein
MKSSIAVALVFMSLGTTLGAENGRAADEGQIQAYAFAKRARHELGGANFNEAIDYFTKAINSALEIQRYYFLVERGKAYLAKGEVENAISDFTIALEMPSNIYDLGRQERGDALLQRQSFQAAITDYDKMVEENPHVLRSRVNRGLAYEGINNLERARQDFEAAIAEKAPIASADPPATLGEVYYPIDYDENQKALAVARQHLARLAK